jgi:hypothetical protein
MSGFAFILWLGFSALIGLVPASSLNRKGNLLKVFGSTDFCYGPYNRGYREPIAGCKHGSLIRKASSRDGA